MDWLEPVEDSILEEMENEGLAREVEEFAPEEDGSPAPKKLKMWSKYSCFTCNRHSWW